MPFFRPLGRSGLATAPLTLGGNVFGWTAGEAASHAVLDAFVDRGRLEVVDELAGLDAAQRTQLDAMVDALQAQASRMVDQRPETPWPVDGGD